MNIDVFSATGSKVKSLELPAALFGAEVNWGLMHQAVVRVQSNRRQSPAHVRTRGEVAGSAKKLFMQKHTGNARRGAIRSPLLRGGGKTFGPRNDKNYIKDMPQKMRHAALRSSLSLLASKGSILGLESYPDTIKTKTFVDLLKKLPIEFGRKVLVVTNGMHTSLGMSARNVAGIKTISANYLNPEDVLNSRHIIFLVDAIDTAEKLFGGKEVKAKAGKKPASSADSTGPKEEKPKKVMKKKPVSKKTTAKNAAKKAASKKTGKPETGKPSNP